MTSGEFFWGVAYHAVQAVYRKCHTSKRPPEVILCRSFTRPSTTLAVIEGLGTRLTRSWNKTFSRLLSCENYAPSWLLLTNILYNFIVLPFSLYCSFSKAITEETLIGLIHFLCSVVCFHISGRVVKMRNTCSHSSISSGVSWCKVDNVLARLHGSSTLPLGRTPDACVVWLLHSTSKELTLKCIFPLLA